MPHGGCFACTVRGPSSVPRPGACRCSLKRCTLLTLRDCVACLGIPVWIGWLRYLSFIYYGFGMLLHYEYHGRTIYSCVDPSKSVTSGMSVQVRAAPVPAKVHRVPGGVVAPHDMQGVRSNLRESPCPLPPAAGAARRSFCMS